VERSAANLDDGRLTDGPGHVVLASAIVVLIMTSNLGTEYIRQAGSIGFLQSTSNDEVRQSHEKIMRTLKETYSS
jgi:ATP-dependent Clp protease ATP-binding subunit ClpA